MALARVSGAEHTERSGHAQVAPCGFSASLRFVNQQQVGVNRPGERNSSAFAEIQFVRDLLNAVVFDGNDTEPRWST